jgi:hypothetical protein
MRGLEQPAQQPGHRIDRDEGAGEPLALRRAPRTKVIGRGIAGGPVDEAELFVYARLSP